MNTARPFSPRFARTARLLASPPPRIPLPAQATVFPLADENEYAAMAALPGVSSSVPILVTMTQMQELLAAVVELAAASLAPLDLCLLTARMPAGPRIPKRLLEPDVFLTGEIAPECRYCLDGGLTVLTMDNRIVRHPLDAGDNSLALAWYGPDDGHERWRGFLEGLRDLGFDLEKGRAGA
ncbi:MAG: hypothetical protein LBP86_03995 [Azoarcus sp.]|jgi:hypothetical protein|nr:hypothetical protein [Azoarcus sp.]